MLTTELTRSDTNHGVDMDIAIARIEAEDNVQSLLLEMQECLAVTVGSIVKLGAIVRRLETLEVDMSTVRIPNMDYFRRVAHGKMLPEVFVEMVGSPLVLRRVSRLPLPDQRSIVDGKPVKVMLPGGDHLLIAPKDMTTGQSKQVFAADHIRSDAQQVAWMAERSQRATLPPENRPVLVDRKRHGIVVGETFISASELAGYLGELATK